MDSTEAEIITAELQQELDDFPSLREQHADWVENSAHGWRTLGAFDVSNYYAELAHQLRIGRAVSAGWYRGFPGVNPDA